MKIQRNTSFFKTLKPKLILSIQKQIRRQSNQRTKEQFQTNVIKIRSIPIKLRDLKLNIIKPQRLSIQSKPTKEILPLMEIENKAKSNKSQNHFLNKQEDSHSQREFYSIEKQNRKNTVGRTRSVSGFFSRKSSLIHISCQKNNEINRPYYEIEQNLKRNSLIHPLSTLLSIKRQNFFQIISKIIRAMIDLNKLSKPQGDEFRDNIAIIRNKFVNMDIDSCIKRSKIQSRVYSFVHKSDYCSKITQYDDISGQLKEVQKIIEEKNFILNKIVEDCKMKEKEMKECHLQIYNIQAKIEDYNLQMELALAGKLEIQSKLAIVQQKYEQMLSYTSLQQRQQVLKMIHKEFHQIEQQIYEYATYLQCNQLANDIYYEPHPFTQIEQLIEADQKQLIDSIKTNDRKTPEEKLGWMTSFITSTMRKFKNKDEEMFKLNQFKTNCILNFINKMKRWLNNWELKKEYLVNLKKDYAAITVKVKDHISDLILRPPPSEDDLKAELKILLALGEDLSTNFSLGNSFY